MNHHLKTYFLATALTLSPIAMQKAIAQTPGGPDRHYRMVAAIQTDSNQIKMVERRLPDSLSVVGWQAISRKENLLEGGHFKMSIKDVDARFVFRLTQGRKSEKDTIHPTIFSGTRMQVNLPDGGLADLNGDTLRVFGPLSADTVSDGQMRWSTPNTVSVINLRPILEARRQGWTKATHKDPGKSFIIDMELQANDVANCIKFMVAMGDISYVFGIQTYEMKLIEH